VDYPSPEPGLVISYSYLWRNEAAAGQVEGTKPHPAAMILVQEQGLKPLVTVVPITHSAPSGSDVAIAIPPRLAARLGLDAKPQWVIVSEANQFHWPGFDIEPNKNGDYVYGFVAPELLKQIAAKFAECAEAGLKPVSRDDTQPAVASAKPSSKQTLAAKTK
jgi:hypothetical protein